jgi:hypothetical protein
MFDFGNKSWIGFALEPSATPATLANGSAPAWPALPGTFTVVGHSKLPTGKRGLNNSKGRAIGMGAPAYNKRGLRTPSVSFQFAPGSLPFIANCLREENADLPELIIYEGVFGQWTRVYRGAKCSTITFDLGPNGGQGGEVMINASFEAIDRYDLTAQPSVTPALLRALGTPLFWHDCRTLNVTDATGGVNSFRTAVHSFTATVNHTLQRIQQRPNYGDHARFSLCSEEIRPTDIVASGEMTWNKKMSADLLDSVANAQDWGNIVATIADGPGLVGATGGKNFVLTATNCLPTDESDGGGESNALRTHTIPFQANNLGFTYDMGA